MGVLITVEGGEFTGKTSLIVPSLKRFCELLGVAALSSREPGGTPHGEEIRQTIFKRLSEKAPETEIAKLMNKARKIHLEEIIKPMLGEHKEKTAVVILDRYCDCSIAYQGLQGGVPIPQILQLEKEHINGYYPDLTLIAYFPEQDFAKTFLVRKHFAEGETTRSKNAYDEGEVEHHLQRQNYYFQVPDIYKKAKIERVYAFIDASRSPKVVVETAIRACLPLLKHTFHSSTEKIEEAMNQLFIDPAYAQWEEKWRAQQEYMASIKTV